MKLNEIILNEITEYLNNLLRNYLNAIGFVEKTATVFKFVVILRSIKIQHMWGFTLELHHYWPQFAITLYQLGWSNLQARMYTWISLLVTWVFAIKILLTLLKDFWEVLSWWHLESYSRSDWKSVYLVGVNSFLYNHYTD